MLVLELTGYKVNPISGLYVQLKKDGRKLSEKTDLERFLGKKKR